MVLYEVCDVQDQVIQDAKFAPILNRLSELLCSHGRFGPSVDNLPAQPNLISDLTDDQDQ